MTVEIKESCSTLMDGLYPTSYCPRQPVKCTNGTTISETGGTWVSNAFIRNRGQTSFVTEPYDGGWPEYLTNNPPPIQIYVRVAPSQYDSKLVYWINGWERPRLNLTRGRKYQLNVVTVGHPFYFTTDPQGGNGNKDNITQVQPSDYYVSTYTMSGTPDHFYYQCALHPGMGGEVIIV